MITIALTLLLQAAVTPAPMTPVKASDPNERICRTVEATGTRLGSSKVCMPAWKWREREEQDRKDLVDMQNSTRCVRNEC